MGSYSITLGAALPLRESIFVVPFNGGRPTLLCADCGEPRAWLPNGAGLLYQKLSSKGESLIGIVKPSGQTVMKSIFLSSIKPINLCSRIWPRA